MNAGGNRPIVVTATDFSETSGGAIALHRLVDRLRAIGEEAYVAPLISRYPGPAAGSFAPYQRLRAAYHNARAPFRARRKFRTNPDFDTPRATRQIIRQAIVVYPEVVDGNPLRSPRVVRWLLHRPGYFFPDVRFGPDELTFFFHHAFCEGVEGIDPDNMLRVRWIRDDIYVNRNLPERSGTCRLIRKGTYEGVTAPPPDDDAIPVDALGHVEKAEVFNRTEKLLSHDPQTMYLMYAAMCGCVPVVLPRPGVSKTQWRSREEDRLGIAYGEEEIGWAIETRQALFDRIAREQAQETAQVKEFVAKLRAKYG